ncbi:peptide-methionine (S)-S-oxide reductase MsrA [Rheinheimera maricola]|uniref:Peptide methionine sulfoxide reductase MsrA n=1 Tax=Rheinheimera maricola TaxID=2793282 RepID=A0ABS7XA56_9GAMM|nr:peptide-methionine (S)-S-oxide reductase MsrA [Rheinheimera maricola]MBZ9611970.1 peptide-methionine (S)-S-oxide reductase MsrA [Rheinheimera maricola]
MTIQTATFGAGCFWCLEAAMNQLNGVAQALSGYMGGKESFPTYQMVCTGNSGHAEVVQLQFEDNIVSFEQLCLIFFSLHDPTQLNRQGNDIGSQYRSVVFYHNDEQLQLVRGVMAELERNKVFPQRIVTEICPAEPFYVAEEHHQGYFSQHPQQGYCQGIVAPKMARFKQQYAAMLKK